MAPASVNAITCTDRGVLEPFPFRGRRCHAFCGGERTVMWSGGGPFYVLATSAAEAADGRVRIDVVPECGAASCVELARVDVVAR